MSRIHLNGHFKSHLSNGQREAIKVNKEFEKRKIRLSNSGQGYRNKVKSIPDFEVEQYDCGNKLEDMVKNLSIVSYNVLQMCTELYNGTPGNIIKDRISGIVAKLLLEYGENSKELTNHLDKMMTEIKETNVDTKLPPNFLTIMLNVINVIQQKRDEEADEIMGYEEEEEEDETRK